MSRSTSSNAWMKRRFSSGRPTLTRSRSWPVADFIPTDMVVAGGTGIAAWLFDAPFLTSTYDYPLWPIVGAVPLASAAAFDLGVFLTVVGATMVALVSITRLHPTMKDSR